MQKLKQALNNVFSEIVGLSHAYIYSWLRRHSRIGWRFCSSCGHKLFLLYGTRDVRYCPDCVMQEKRDKYFRKTSIRGI